MKHASTRAAKLPAKVTPKVEARSTTAHVTVARPARAQALAAPSKPSPQPVASSGSAVTPVVSLNAKPAQPSPARTTGTAAKHDNTLPISAGGALALLAIGGAAVAMKRRRSEDEAEWTDEQELEAEPFIAHAALDEDSSVPVHEEQPPLVTPPTSAFQWSRSGEPAVNAADEPFVENDDREPGETWVQRAYRGPSALNPSVSLKARLKRAAFFDKREREAAAGLAAPVDPTAGLPERMVEEDQQESESEFA